MMKSSLAALLFAPSPAAFGPAPLGAHLNAPGCVSGHQQTPRSIIDALPLAIVTSCWLADFRPPMKPGVTRGGRDLRAQGSVMGIVATPQCARFSDQEVAVVRGLVTAAWTAARGLAEQQKMPAL